MTSKPGFQCCSGMSLAGVPSSGQVVSGVQAARARSAAFVGNRRRRVATLPGLSGPGDRESARETRGQAPAGCVRVPSRGAPADRLVVVVKLL